MVDIFFSIFILEQELSCQDRFQKLSLQIGFFANRVIYFGTNRNSVNQFKDFRK